MLRTITRHQHWFVVISIFPLWILRVSKPLCKKQALKERARHVRASLQNTQARSARAARNQKIWDNESKTWHTSWVDVLGIWSGAEVMVTLSNLAEIQRLLVWRSTEKTRSSRSKSERHCFMPWSQRTWCRFRCHFRRFKLPHRTQDACLQPFTKCPGRSKRNRIAA